MNRRSTQWIAAVVADEKGNIFDLDGYAAVGMAAKVMTPLAVHHTVDLPFGSELMLLPDRRPVVFNLQTKRLETITCNPYAPDEPVFPVAAFNSPGYVISFVSAYEEGPDAGYLPLFSYGAVGWAGGFRSAVIRIDRERRQDLRLMKPENVTLGVREMRKKMPRNRLRKHLETCALVYGCPAGKNFFLGRYEAPLPTSRRCNARCLGCISRQENPSIRSCHERISFTPSPEEIAEIALTHIMKVDRSVVSFGQGCEGEPLLAADVIEPALKLIRSETDRGTINMNTNAGRPDALSRLFDAGLDSIRVSLNSVQERCYDSYFRPVGYRFLDVLDSFKLAIQRGKFVSINYLNCPGFTDSPGEIEAFVSFIETYPVNHIQWRNLNFDPLRYWRTMDRAAFLDTPLGMQRLLEHIKERFPGLTYGYFNPPKEKWHVRQR